VTRVTARAHDDGAIASWAVDLSLFMREPTTPL